jgi:hypothetical protein
LLRCGIETYAILHNCGIDWSVSAITFDTEGGHGKLS